MYGNIKAPRPDPHHGKRKKAPKPKAPEGDKSGAYVEFVKEVSLAYRNNDLQAANPILAKHIARMSPEERIDACRTAHWIANFVPDRMYYRMAGPETPTGLFDAYIGIKRTGQGNVDLLLAYLEADPFYFGSGYIKIEILRMLKRDTHSFSQRQAVHLRNLILRAVRNPPTSLSKSYWRIAFRVANQEFLAEVDDLGRSITHVGFNAYKLRLVLSNQVHYKWTAPKHPNGDDGRWYG